MPLKPKTCLGCGVSLPWEMDTTYLSDFARWLSHRRLLCSGEDTYQFYEDPHKWLADRLEGDLHAEYESERKVAAWPRSHGSSLYPSRSLISRSSRTA